MTKSLKIQGAAFSIIALVVSLLSFVIVHPDEKSELIVLSALILLLGVPHGAFDTIFAWRLYGIHTPLAWLGFVLLYLFLAACVVAVWLLAPIVFLVGFLLISLVHFSGDPMEGTPLPTRLLYGGSVLILPALFHSPEMARLFGMLVGADAASTIMPALRLLSWIWLPCALLAVALRVKEQPFGALEIVCVVILSVIATPLVSFTLFFCGMHSARHILRTIDYSGRASTKVLLVAGLLPMIGVLLVSATAWYFLKGVSLEARIIEIVFVGLAALTVPHMVLVERVRISGWVKGAHHSDR